MLNYVVVLQLTPLMNEANCISDFHGILARMFEMTKHGAHKRGAQGSPASKERRGACFCFQNLHVQLSFPNRLYWNQKPNGRDRLLLNIDTC